MPRQIQGSQTDFSFGEVDVALKRADQHPARKYGLRQMANARILSSGALQDRSGRRALYPSGTSTRIEELTLSPGNIFKIEFGPAHWQIRNSANVVVATAVVQGNGAALPWSAVTLTQIVYCVIGLNIYLTFPGMRPQVISWNGVATWTFSDYTEAVLATGQKRTTFYRLSPQNVTMQPSATTGNITVTFSSPIAVAGMVGTRVRYANRQILLTGLVSPSVMNATVIEPLPPGQQLGFSSNTGVFGIGDLVEGSVSGAQGIVTQSPTIQYVNYAFISGSFSIGDSVTGAPSGATGTIVAIGGLNLQIQLTSGTAFAVGDNITDITNGSVAALLSVTSLTLTVQLLSNENGNTPFFVALSDTVVGPSGQGVVNSTTTVAPQAISIWDDEVMNAFRGYPASCFADQFRLGLCNFPQLKSGICWSAINSPTDLYANDASSPDNAIFEIAPGNIQVYFVVPGPESSEFVFGDTAIYYIPISTTSPLAPGSVGFQLLSGDGAARVQPRVAQEAILYVNAGGNRMMAVIATGAYNKPFNAKNLSEFHQHLFTNIQCIAAPNADGQFLERYAYVLNGDGSIAVGKYQAESLQGNQPVIGWGPWSGAAAVSWIAAWNADVLFTSSYFGAAICEILDDTQYLDCALAVNAAPAAFAPAAGKGPLWFIPNQSVTLMDQVTRAMGTYQIDGNGFIVPQNNGGENLAIASLVAGQPWTMTVEPFANDAQSGPDMHQRMLPRSISYMAVYVINSTGLTLAKLFSSAQTPTSPPLGTVMNIRRVPPWNLGDDPTKPPPLRETVEEWRPSGASYDPRVCIIKDVPGPLMIQEIGMEITI